MLDSLTSSSQDVYPIVQKIPNLSLGSGLPGSLGCLGHGFLVRCIPWLHLGRCGIQSCWKGLSGVCLAFWLGHSPHFLAVSPAFISSMSDNNSFYDSRFFLAGKLLEAKTYAMHSERQGHTLSSLPVAITRLDTFLQVRWISANWYLSCQTPWLQTVGEQEGNRKDP